MAKMMSIEQLQHHLDVADAAVDRATETVARAHDLEPGSRLVDEALDDLVLALRERDMWQHHLNVAMASQTGWQAGGAR